MFIGDREFDTENNCYIVGILNVAPDSFFDGGKWNSFDGAMYHAENMIKGGVDIIDVGGESTRPGYTPITAHEETDRAVPIVEGLRRRFDAPVSIDTYKSEVAAEAIRAGASLVNDIWGLKRDSNMARAISEARVACCLSHNRENTDYADFMRDMLADLRQSAEIASKAGIENDKIILDPGIGFAKPYRMNLEAINKLDMVGELGYPVLLGVSRKSFIGLMLGLPVTERLEGSLAAAVIGVARGCSFVRTHDVRETKRAVSMAKSIIRGY
ncbi:MAG: dihydropteroate synthase [Oscillospiraceae bacterium]|nr:dihydropteroate synthase [Oscillospiraceae bacterium]